MSRTLFKKPAGRPSWRACLGGALLALVLIPASGSAQSVAEKYQMARDRNSQFNLNAGPTAVLAVNQYQCGLQSDGPTCTDVFDSPTGGGGFWPTGSPNQYMFNSGLQVAGIIPIAADCTTAQKATANRPDCFPWAGDTTGAFFFDASGVRQHGTALTDIYDSLNPDDLANWPTEGFHPDFPNVSAFVQDTSLFNDVLIGRAAASQQDSWVMYWDGDPSKTGGRTHPMGILVEQRSLAWNYPQGNENVIYFIYKFTNVTNNALFQQMNEARYAIQLPDAGWRFDSIYVAFAADPDVTPDAGENYATAVLPFNVGLSYKDDFTAPDFVYPPSIFHAPFFETSPGMVAMQYLKSPIDPATGEEVGLTSFSLTTNGGPFPDPSTVQRGWRYISLNTDAGKGDANCTFQPDEVRERKSCFLLQTPSDVRMFVGSGPFTLEPGASATIAVAQYAAATVNMAGSIVPGTDNKPEFPSAMPGCAGQPIRPIERAAGYLSVETCPADGQPLGIFDVNVVPNSLLGRAQVAQSIFSNKFLLGFAPETPTFYLVPGDNRITVVWEPSATEQNGDPFFAAAGNPENPLFDPNYREFDVEGYRIYRGTTPANMEMIAQFDKSGTVFTDNLCVTEATFVPGDDCTEVHEVDITSPFVQYTNVARLENGDPIVLAADTALAVQIAAGNAVPLSNTGIPYNYIDTDVRNGFQYFYRVTAFDVNSISSGPSSLESAGGAKSAVPTAPSTALTNAVFEFGVYGRGERLDAPNHTINPATGTFSGPSAPTNSFDMAFAAFAPQLLPQGSASIRLDSILPAYYGAEYHFTNLTTGNQVVYGGTEQNSLANILSGGDATQTFELPVLSLASDPTVRAQLQAQGIDAPPLAGAMNSTFTLGRFHFNSADADWAYEQPGFWGIDPPNTEAGGSRWFAGTAETEANPTLGDGTAGSLPGVTVWRPTPYTITNVSSTIQGALFRRFQQTVWGLHRAADMRVYWGAAGIDSIIDVTHNVPVQFSTHLRATYGFIGDNDSNGRLDWGDITYIAGTEAVPNISRTPKQPLSRTPVTAPVDVTGDLVADGPGFALYITGEPFFFQGEVPANTVWTLRTYNGSVTRTNDTYAFTPTQRNANVPGLVVQVTVEAPAQIVAAEADLTRVHTVPDPYYVASIFDLSPTAKELQFVNLPAQASIRIYSLSGVLVDVVNHNSPAGGGIASWNLRNRSNQFVASGVYLYHVSTPDGKSHVGKFTVINSGIAR